MKILLETFFSIVFIGIIIACLPTIMGLFSLCVIAYFIYQAAKNLFEDETETLSRPQRRENTYHRRSG